MYVIVVEDAPDWRPEWCEIAGPYESERAAADALVAAGWVLDGASESWLRAMDSWSGPAEWAHIIEPRPLGENVGTGPVVDREAERLAVRVPLPYENTFLATCVWCGEEKPTRTHDGGQICYSCEQIESAP